MTRRTRRILFWLAVAFFVAATPIIVSYARGYRFDFSGLALSQVGAIALETKPKEATVWLNNKKLSKTTPTIIRNLFPERNYELRVEREGFWPWEKELEVEPELVTAARNIILFPRELKLAPALDEETAAAAFFLSSSAEYVLINETSGSVSVIRPATKERVGLDFPDRLRTAEIKDVAWASSGNQVIFNRFTARSGRWYLAETGTGRLTNLNETYKIQPTTVRFADSAGSKIIAVTNKGPLVIDLLKTSTANLLIEDTKLIDVHDDRVVIFKKPDLLLSSNISGEPIVLYGNLRFVPDNILISPDGKKVAFWHNWHIGVIWLEDTTGGIFRKRGEQEIVFPSLSPLKRVRWHSTSEYLMAYLENNEFSVVELDGRGEKHNTWTWKIPESRSFDYADSKEELWFLDSNGALLRHTEKF